MRRCSDKPVIVRAGHATQHKRRPQFADSLIGLGKSEEHDLTVMDHRKVSFRSATP